MLTISQSEIDDYKKALKTQGYSEKDFEYKEENTTKFIPSDTLTSTNIVYGTGKITIKNTSTNKNRTYNTGQGSKWVIEFSEDLEKGLFN